MSGPTYYGLDMARLLINPINRYTNPDPNPSSPALTLILTATPTPDPNPTPNPTLDRPAS